MCLRIIYESWRFRSPMLSHFALTASKKSKRKEGERLQNVTTNALVFSGAFPGHPIMPGVLILEAKVAQVGGAGGYGPID